jgi:hypothetical protein
VGLSLRVGTLLRPGLHLEAGIMWARHIPRSPSDLRMLVGAPPGASVDGGEFSTLTASIGGRYYILRSYNVQPYAAISIGNTRTTIDGVQVRSDLLMRRFDESAELSPWVGASFGARHSITPSLSLCLESGVSAAYTDSEPTYRISVDAGLRYSF